MTRSDYQRVANALRSARELAETQDEIDGVELVTLELAREFELDSRRFNKAKFLEAAEYKSLAA